MIIDFEFDYAINKNNLREFKVFVTDALEAWGGQRHPEDWLFGSLENVKVRQLERLAIAATLIERLPEQGDL
jgi:hypothetical protein